MIKAGHSRESSIWTAAALARKTFFKIHPSGALPLWLAYPKTFRLKKYYDEHGEPVRTLQDNPRTIPNIAQATRLYKGFTGVAPRTLKKLTLPPMPKTALAIGRVLGIIYTVDATNEAFKHEFKSKARPLLIVSADGHQVFLRGGAFTFTKRGFVDKPGR